jgi:hypothetical protein
MCDVPSIAVCCSESIERFPGIASRFILNFFTIPVAQIIIIIIIIIIIGGPTCHKLLTFSQPAYCVQCARRNTSVEICYVQYLGSREVHCILRHIA